MKILVIGAGAWGTALAISAAAHGSGHSVVLWARDVAQAQAMQVERANTRYLESKQIKDTMLPMLYEGYLAGWWHPLPVAC